jgi:hypothetical protein
VVKHRVAPSLGHARSAADDHDRDLLREAAGDRVDDAEPANPVRHVGGAGAPHASVPVGREPRAVLLRAADHLDRALLQQAQEAEVVVAGDAEGVVDAQALEPLDQVAGDRPAHGRGRRRAGWGSWSAHATAVF